MSRLIPAKVRSEGAELYRQGLVTDVLISALTLTADVDGEPVVYDLDGASDSCFCEDFKRTRRYCKHIAAIEEYLKYEKAGRAEVEEVQSQNSLEREKSAQFESAATFLSDVNEDLTRENTDTFSVSVEISDSATSDDFGFASDFLVATLRLHVNRAARGYIIRDIPGFLRTLRRSEGYSMGQHYFPMLSLSRFDGYSRALLSYMLRLQIDDDNLLHGTLYKKNGRYFAIPYVFVENFLELSQALTSCKLMIDGRRVSYWSFAALDETADIYRFTVKALDDSISLTISEEEAFALYKDRYLYYQNCFYQLTDAQVQLVRKLSALAKSEEGEIITALRPSHLETLTITFSYNEKDALAQALQEFGRLGTVKAPDSFKIRSFKPHFDFSIADDALHCLQVVLRFDYGDFSVEHFQELQTLEFARDMRLEKKIFDLLAQVGFPKGFRSQRVPLAADELYDFYEVFLPDFEALGVVSLDAALRSQEVTATPEISVAARGNLLDVSFSLPDMADGEVAAILKNLLTDNPYYITDSGKYVKLDARFNTLKEALTSFDDVEISDNHLTTHTYHSLQLSQIFSAAEGSSFSEQFQNLYRDLTQPQHFDFTKPEALTADLRSYQEDGIRWMRMLAHYHMGGILADDMGLGKTLQAITYLLSDLAEEASGPALIVAPSSLLYNWQDEFEKFAPGALDIQVVDGIKESRDEMIGQDRQVYITSYGSFLKDADLYEAKGLGNLLLDEAQVVKNFNSKTNRSLARLSAAHTFALSGTPIENKLDELWAIFNIIMPGFLPTRKKFLKLRPEKILKTIKPFVMRRKKEEVLTELPDKLEITHTSELTDEQKVIYIDQLEQMQKTVMSMNRAEFSRRRIEILAGITRLRQICDTPGLFAEGYQGGSGKLNSLTSLLQQVKDSGRRPLIFSQFTKMFPFVEEELTAAGLTYYKLTGSTKSRERIEMVRAFNAGSRDVFLISLKAGGVGLNLASSDMVILVDLWWNPAVEEQAISRAHRMGQKNMVEVIRLITKGTIEEKILAIQQRKKDLFTAILDNSDSSEMLSKADIHEILGIKP